MFINLFARKKTWLSQYAVIKNYLYPSAREENLQLELTVIFLHAINFIKTDSINFLSNFIYINTKNI